jgi:8-oxo-dGTP pyrophosphatase MutT (NUDIX family)
MDFSVGFLFDDGGNVALIRKNRPAWQAGRLNGIGGQIEPGETPLEAMRREFREEAGCDGLEWRNVGLVWGEGYNLFVFSARSAAARVRTMTDEAVAWYPVSNLPGDIVRNLTWLVPMADYRLPITAMIHHESATD